MPPSAIHLKAHLKGGCHSARPPVKPTRVHALAPELSAVSGVPAPSSSSSSTSAAGACAGVNRRLVQRLREQRATAMASPRPRRTVLQAVAAPERASIAMKTVNVDLGDRSYPIYIGQGLLNQGELLRKHIPGKRVLIVTNETIAPLYLERCKAALTEGGLQVDEVILPDGEEYKSMDVLGKVWDKALEARLDRGATFLALGGGVVGDMTGFAAACYQRGVHFVQVPTTVMAQVDSSVGGKTGVNHPLGKNMIGAFYQPQVVLVDTDTLGTLPDRELASGISEVIKYGLIRDAAFFEWLEINMERLLERDPEAIAYAVERSCVNKAEVVAADERESSEGVRATLNLGHTFGHAIEAATGYGTWLHGEAVAAGTAMAADMSLRLGWIDRSLHDRILALLRRARLPTLPPASMSVEQFRSFMAVDKKVLAGKLRLILLQGPLGSCVVTGDFEPRALDDTIAAFVAQAQAEGYTGPAAR
ncbi:hypothetical protein HYH03_018914 [Edaphochlamys debaryana]|uniref:3-dehydroquinate synthase, chloroplastic n=1 Tax=Edaphochlamys debaryana TaxID=47281 RepID=A0A836BP02_9CHLO|nr:hypothetical protein HYH03_018914 [Edaphochlamys debaryana]|eukprot:KAG2482128.1 hypothetical protein HYH03_018914 [Edaphochlamys debaryana]